jgi:phosphatidylethanolamine/phosphatidyl-N-methylethanolamine N-methyltransferase
MTPIIATNEPARWAQLVVYTALLTAATRALTADGGLPLDGVARALGLRGLPPLAVDPASPALRRALAAVVWAPIAWNVFPRLEFRHRVFSRPLRSRTAALYAFALYIVCFSSLRERLFFAAVEAAPVWSAGDPRVDAALVAFGTLLVAVGAVLSAAGFYHLRITHTYMGEYFGFMMPRLITAFPFNVDPDPMYNGSVLMHLGYALRARSPTGLFLALVVALSYWIAAKLFEEPFMAYCYANKHKLNKNAPAAADPAPYGAKLE